MASNYTEHYKLNQWSPEDKVLRTEFNADNAKLEAALADMEQRKCNQETLMAVANIVGTINNELTALKKRVSALEGK